MLRDDGSIGTESIAVAPALWDYRKKLKLIALIGMIVGGAGLVVYIVLGTVLGGENEDAPRWVDAFLIFAVPFAFGLIGTITFARLKSREKAENCTASFIFYADCFFYCYKNSQSLEERKEKLSYSDAVVKRESDSYVYFFKKGRGLFLVFGKAGLSENELNTIRTLFNQPVSGETAELKNYKSEEIQ